MTLTPTLSIGATPQSGSYSGTTEMEKRTMCGRYSLVCIDDLGNRFRVFNPMIGARSRFNIPPGNEMPLIVRAQKNELVIMQWGLVPHWAQDQKPVKPLINARAETLP